MYMGPCIVNRYLITVQQDATQKTIVYLLQVCLTNNPKLRSTENTSLQYIIYFDVKKKVASCWTPNKYRQIYFVLQSHSLLHTQNMYTGRGAS